MTFAHFGQVAHRFFELAQCFFGLAFQGNHRENGDREAQFRAIQIGVIAADHAQFLERADPAQAWRRG